MDFEELKKQHGEDAVKEAFMLGVIQGLKQARAKQLKDSPYTKTRSEFMKSWGVDGMPADKIRLVNAAWDRAEWFFNQKMDALKAQEWRPIEKAPHGKAVLVFYKNSLGKGRIIKAKYIKKHTEEACEECVAIGFSDYCEEKDEYFTPEGWYELIDNGHEYSSYFLEASNKPSHWQPLPPSPEEQ